MKQLLHKLFITCILVCAGQSAFAYDFKVDSFYYTKLSEKTVKLTCDQYDVESNYGPYYYSSTMKKYSGNVVIPSSVSDGTSTYQVVAIDDAVFYECTDLVSVDIPLGVKTIGNFAFYGCSNLISMNIPDGVTEIFDFAFDGCNGMLWINIPNSVTFIGGNTFRNCSGLTSITIPDKITFIGDYTFYNCSNLTSITIPDGITSIGNWSFMDCRQLKTINIGKGVTEIGANAFVGCWNVKEITCTAVTPPECKYDALATISRTDCTLYVPETSISDYKNTAPWSEFFNIKGIGESTDVISPNTQHGVVVSAQNGNIMISGTVSGETVSVYNAVGSLVKNVKAQGDNTIIGGLNDNNVYVVKIGGSSVKIAM